MFCRCLLAPSSFCWLHTLYNPAFTPPPLRCFNCNKYGHTGKYCRSAQRCKKCGTNHPHSDCQNTLRCVNCGGPHSAAYGGCPRYRLEVKIKSVMTSENLDYWTARQLVQNQTATIPPNIASKSDFPSLPRTSTSISQPQRKNPHTALRLSPNQPRLATTPIDSDTASDDVISLSSAKFFGFIAEVIKDTLTEFSKNKNVDVDAIIIKSASSRLSI